MKSLSTLRGVLGRLREDAGDPRTPCQIPPQPLDRFQLWRRDVVGLGASYTPVWGTSLSHQYSWNRYLVQGGVLGTLSGDAGDPRARWQIPPQPLNWFWFCHLDVTGLDASYTPVWGTSLPHQYSWSSCNNPTLVWLFMQQVTNYLRGFY